MRFKSLLLLICGSGAANLQIEGELSFDLKTGNRLEHPLREGLKEKVDLNDKRQVTAGSVMECIYQYPEQKQIDAILSNMMNMLTKVFVRAHDFFTNGDGRRAESKGTTHPESRFRVIHEKNTQFFEDIYHNMTHEYSKLYNTTVERVDRSTRDPCQHQAEIKQVWRELLDNSMVTFRRAALHCVEEHLKVERNDEKVRSRLAQFLVRELARVRSGQLHLLCDSFQLCYNELF